jgi:putative N-acetylmannosamine-6-phosphate epimerase
MNKFAYRLSTKGNKKIIKNEQTYPIYGIEQRQQQDSYIYI